MTSDEEGEYDLPGHRQHGLHLKEVDATGVQLIYEGLENMGQAWGEIMGQARGENISPAWGEIMGQARGSEYMGHAWGSEYTGQAWDSEYMGQAWGSEYMGQAWGSE